MLAAIRGIASLRLICNKCSPQPSGGNMPNIFRTFLPLIACLLASVPARATCHVDRATTVPLTIEGSRLFVPMSINETPGQFLLDTGSEDTLLSADYAARAHVGMSTYSGPRAGIFTDPGRRVYIGSSNTSLPVNQAHARHIDFGTISFQDWQFSVIPPEAAGTGFVLRDGNLGMDFLHYFDTEIDLQAGKLTIWRVTGCSEIHPVWQGDYDALPLKHTGHQHFTVPAFVDNAELELDFDTGAGGAWLTREAAAKAGVTDAMLAQDHPVRAMQVGVRLPDVIHQFQVLLIGSGEFDKPEIYVDREKSTFAGTDGYIDWRYMKAQRLWISYDTNTLFVQTGAKQK
jgi:predicted aspartyl protease